jgi:hypothetical protein
MSLTACIVGILATVAIASTRTVHAAQREPKTCLDSAGFVGTSGKDTLVLENVSFAGHEVTAVLWSPDGTNGYRLSLNDSLVATDGDFFIWAKGHPIAEDCTQHAMYRLVGDTAIVGVKSGARSQIQRNATQRNAAVLFDVAVGLEEVLTRRARKSGKTSVDIPTFYVASGGYSPIAHIRFIGKDSVTASYSTRPATRSSRSRLYSSGSVTIKLANWCSPNCLRTIAVIP